VSAPQSLPSPVPADEARWGMRLSKTQRAVLRELWQAPKTWAALNECIAGRINAPAVSSATTRLLVLGFVAWDENSRRYHLTPDGRVRAQRTRPKL
jgi:hypothetical protein